MKRYMITEDVIKILHDADTDLNEVRRLIWSLTPIPEWATHFAMRADYFRAEDIPGGTREIFVGKDIPNV